MIPYSSQLSISIHAPRVGSDYYKCYVTKSAKISIHAPRVGSDYDNDMRIWFCDDFNPRSPCGERLTRDSHIIAPSYFNPRSPCGERRLIGAMTIHLMQFQSTLPVWGATFWAMNSKTYALLFQSTLPVWGATEKPGKPLPEPSPFQSTLPVWGATKQVRLQELRPYISIHAPRVGSDTD